MTVTVRPPDTATAAPTLPVAYLRTALTFLVPGGSLLGALMILQLAGLVPFWAWTQHLRSHSHMQVFGFVVLFTMGIALLVVPRLTGAGAPRGALAAAPLVAVATGTLAAVAGFPKAATVLETIGTIAFLFAVRRSASAPSDKPSPVTQVHRMFALAGGLWLVGATAAANLDLVLWGFASLYIMAVGLLIHPRILGLPTPALGGLKVALVAWNLGLALQVARVPGASVLLLVGGLAYVASLRPFGSGRGNCEAPPWLRFFIRLSYAWLLATLAWNVLAPQHAAPLRHALASGFILTMMMGMAYRIVPNFCKCRLAWATAPWVTLVLLGLGTLLRVGAQALAVKPVLAAGGLLQFSAVLVFGLTLWVSLGRKA